MPMKGRGDDVPRKSHNHGHRGLVLPQQGRIVSDAAVEMALKTVNGEFDMHYAEPIDVMNAKNPKHIQRYYELMGF